MSDDDKFITVPVRVPADLEVKSYAGLLTHKRLENRDGVGVDYPTHDGVTWYYAVHQQIAAAIEARKPKPPKFAVGDVVEWQTMGGERWAGIVSYAHRDGSYDINGGRADGTECVDEAALTLVRRAEK